MDNSIKDIKKILRKYHIFVDSNVLTQIDQTQANLSKEIKTSSLSSVIEILKKCTENIKELKAANMQLELSECKECLQLLGSIKEEIERDRAGIRELKRFNRVMNYVFRSVVILLICALIKYLYK